MPHAVVVDVSHRVEPYNVLQGAWMLADAVPYLPVGVHVAVVDPGVGTARRAVTLHCADGRSFVGPDNGVLVPAAERPEIELAVALPPLSAPDSAHVTFAGRDVFAPAAARLAGGTSANELGDEIDPATLCRLTTPAPELDGERFRVLVLATDRFGTLQLACTLGDLEGVSGARVAVNGGRELVARRGRTFADVEPGELVLYEDAFSRAALAVREGSAAAQLGVGSGEWVTLRSA